MPRLDHQLNILLDQETYKLLISLVKSKNTSMGALIREAVDKVYKKSEVEGIETKQINKMFSW